jgi:PEGA domain
MGSQQIFRNAVAVLAVAIATSGSVAGDPSVVVVDLRTNGDPAVVAALVDALTDVHLAPVSDDRGRVLAGRDPLDLMADAALGQAKDGYGQLDCGWARPSAELAARLLASAGPGGRIDVERTTRAWTYVLLCADRDGDRPMARYAADRVRAGGGAANIPADLAGRFPDIDAALGAEIVPVTITGPVGALVTLDDRPIGSAPTTVLVTAGKHMVAVADRTGAGATVITVQGRAMSIAVDYEIASNVDIVALWPHLRAWRVAGAVDPTTLAGTMATLDVELAAVIDSHGAIELWQRPSKRSQSPSSIVVGHGDPAAIAVAARSAYDLAHERAPTIDVPILREHDHPKPTVQDPTRWWIYAAIGGALVAGAVSIYAADSGDDHQRFELRFP